MVKEEKIDEYSIEKTDSFTLKKYSIGDDLNYCYWLKNQIIYLSKDSACLIIIDSEKNVLKRADFLPEFQRRDILLRPYMMNFGQLNDSTIVCYYESRWPYDDQKIFLVNLNSMVVTFPFKIDHHGLISSSDNSIKDFNDAYYKKKTWLAVNNSKIYVDKTDTLVYIPVFSGDIYSGLPGSLRSNVNSIYAFQTQSSNRNTSNIPVYFSRLNPIFKDSFIQSGDLYTLSNPSISLTDSDGFYIQYLGSNNIIYYNVKNQSVKHIHVDFPENVYANYFIQAKTKQSDEIIKFSNFQENSSENEYLRPVNIPTTLNPEWPQIGSQFRYLVYDSFFNLTGICKDNLFYCRIRGKSGQQLVGYNQQKSINDSAYFHLYAYRVVKSGVQISKDSVLTKQNSNKISSLAVFLENFSNSINSHDTIPVLHISGRSPKNRHQIGLFIQELQKENISFHPFVLVSPKPSSYLDFKKDYQLNDHASIYLDLDGKFYHHNISDEMGWIIKTGDGRYKYENVSSSDLEKLLRSISFKVRMVKGFCLPVKD